jgi:myo-inositol-1(or 4)-monophosphatase
LELATEEPLAFAIQLAQQVGDLLLGYFQSSELQAELKSDLSVVTQADLEADRVIKAAIRCRYPDDFLLSEEKQPGESGLEFSAERAVWIVDPLDGTTNFSLGLHYWGVLLARLVSGWPELAVMYFPVVHELYHAQRGKGAYLNHKPLRVKPPEAGCPLSFFACCSRTFRRYQVSVPYKARILGSAAYTLCTVARSTAILGFEATAKIWDLAAPWLLVGEAGGVIETLDGSQPFPLLAENDYTIQSFPVLASANAEIAGRAHQQIIAK